MIVHYQQFWYDGICELKIFKIQPVAKLNAVSLHHHISSLWVCFVKSKHHIYTCTDWFEGELILRTEYYLCGAHWTFHKALLELI